ncbi:MAG: ABC transporter substrate-binding protein, partial [Pseudomonas sp.]
MRASLKRSLLGAALALAIFGSAVPMAQASADQQFFPLATYRVGAYASSGVQ